MTGQKKAAAIRRFRLKASGETGRLVAFDREPSHWRDHRPRWRVMVILELDRDGRKVIVGMDQLEEVRE